MYARFATLVVPVALALVPSYALAQPGSAPPTITIVAPAHLSTRHAINPKIRIEYDSGQCVDMGDGMCDPVPSSLIVKLNTSKTNYASSFTASEWYAQNGTGNAGNLNLNGSPGSTTSNTIYAKICNGYNLCAEQTITVYIQPKTEHVIRVDPLHPAVSDPGRCEAVPFAPGAGFACDALVLTHGLPGYVSLGEARSVAVVYSSRSAAADVIVPFGVDMLWDAAASTVSAWLTGYGTTWWQGADWDGASGTVRRRLVLVRPEIVDTARYIGRDTLRVHVRATTAAQTVDSTKLDTLLYYFERDTRTTPIARGWGIAGLSRIYGSAGHNPGTGAPTGDVFVVGGGGSIHYYKKLTGNDYGRPEGAFAKLTRYGAGNDRWLRFHIDGTREFYSWVNALGYARLDSVVVAQRRTRITYRSATSGSPDSIIDPFGKAIKFLYHTSGTYDGRVSKICALPGATERCTEFTYGTSGTDIRVVSIKDPDNVVTTYGYSGAPHWSLITTITPRARGTYTVGYHTAIRRPAQVTLPAGGQVLTYRAPVLGGFALTGGTSGSPAATAHPDSGWGWVTQPSGAQHRFAVDRYGGLTYARGPDNVVTRITRNLGGQVLGIARGTQGYGGWSYNSMGAVTAHYPEAGDTNRYTYSGACLGTGTGYPCIPTQLVVIRSPFVPDTTKWVYRQYDTIPVVDSLYRSGFGWTRYWRNGGTSYWRVDSLVDARGDRRRFTYEGTWGNPSAEIRDTITTCVLGPPKVCSTTRDTTAFEYDVTGRVHRTRRGTTGRVVRTFYDLVSRDTMAIDSAPAGGGAITTKVRYNDAARTVTVVDGRANSIVFLHDDRGRRIRRTDAAGARDTFAYDGDDRLTTWTNRRNQAISYVYDQLNRIVKKRLPGDSVVYGYHATHGTLDTIRTPRDTIIRTRDFRGRMTQERTIVGTVNRTVQYTYNEAGGVTGLTDPWGGAYTFGWTAATRSRTVTNPFSEMYTIRYNADGLIQAVAFPTGKDSLTYNNNHQVIRAGLSAEVAYERDAVTTGINRISWGGVDQVFKYDGFDRLSLDSVTTTGYGPQGDAMVYDAAGNRTGSPGTYTYTASNAVRGRPANAADTFQPGDTLLYDATGNPIWWKNKSTNHHDLLTWDAENRLTRLQRFNGSTTLLDIHYWYDGLGRRIRKWGPVGVTAERRYVWNGWELLAETDASGNAVRRYTHHPEGIDFPIAMREGSTTHYFDRDGQGNVYKVRNSAGTVRSHYRYRAWGDRYNVSAENVASPFTYKGAQEDRETGLMYMRYRYYSPRLERFVNEDPIGELGGLNLYSFVSNDPANQDDPSGLCPPCAIALGPFAWGILKGAGVGIGINLGFNFAIGAKPTLRGLLIDAALGAGMGGLGTLGRVAAGTGKGTRVDRLITHDATRTVAWSLPLGVGTNAGPVMTGGGIPGWGIGDAMTDLVDVLSNYRDPFNGDCVPGQWQHNSTIKVPDGSGWQLDQDACTGAFRATPIGNPAFPPPSHP